MTIAAELDPQGVAGADPYRAIEQFLYRQSELLDRKRWREYIDLFAEDGIYWVPAQPEHTSGEGMPSIFYENRDLMEIRMKRLHHPRAWSQKTSWGTSHVVSNVVVEHENRRAGEFVVRSRFHMTEFRRDELRHFAGSYEHQLVTVGERLRIRQQRVDLINAEGPYEYVLQAWV